MSINSAMLAGVSGLVANSSALAASPARIALPISFDAALRRSWRSCSRPRWARRSSSLEIRSSAVSFAFSADHCRFTKASASASGFSRIHLMSCMSGTILGEGGQGVNRIPCRCKMAAAPGRQIFSRAPVEDGAGRLYSPAFASSLSSSEALDSDESDRPLSAPWAARCFSTQREAMMAIS